MHIGVAGLGAMGAAIAARLLEVGHRYRLESQRRKPSCWRLPAPNWRRPRRACERGRGCITILTDGAAIDAAPLGRPVCCPAM